LQRAQKSLKRYPQRLCSDTESLPHLPVPDIARYDAITPSRYALPLGSRQQRYMHVLPNGRKHVQLLEVERVEGIPPAIAIAA
jgi:hypothetical protein